ncbi:glycosyltransferase [Rugosimonospora acidiphila]
MRILVTVNDAYGHVLPLVPTLRRMRDRRHEVVLASPGDRIASLGLDGIRLWRYPWAPPDNPPAPPTDPDPAHRLAWATTLSFPHDARGWVEALLADARRFRPDLIVSEPVEHAGRVVAAALGVPLVEHGWGFTLPAGTDSAGAAGLGDVYAAAGTAPREPDLRVDLGPAAVQAPDAQPHVARYRHVPWSIPTAALPPPGKLPRVLLTLGTYPHPGADQRLRAAARAASTLGVELVVALGNADRGSAGTGWPAGVRVTDWIDLPAESARCTLVIHHAGAGSCWAALAAGVPAVCLPQAADQFRNAALVARAGAGVVVEPAVGEVADLRASFAAALGEDLSGSSRGAGPDGSRSSLADGAARVRDDNAALEGTDALVDRIEAVGSAG